ncbi:helix-turn-helix transcriptional regulator [Salmonella enterica]|uniref:Helix-turn-helix transcriptional regulator n=5 Tax=Salmonella enterica TaxID=28901 RepID=A0A3V6WSV9_SALET|nr:MULTISPECIES: helix-turn-helix transcriptional regulator [Salmonella]EAA8613593.1 XRE family transcriptional regulator [Salmonella enterica subsp. enterica]EBS2905520.1 XRE family transcriptional regulator [Salmonella enterica subsp. enterica serovar Flottbek]EBU8749400.1 XRE family transcriptional regulator [Salmonella enterica subsp. enterica serovar Ordonez]EBV8192114.1 XRE family transcriptional regulator [Salmonella enterica subsp. enterica serovar Derby]ECB7828813.1 XRE family transcr
MSSIYSEEYQLVIKSLRAARLDKGMTQAQLAKALGKPQSFIAKVESGERRLDVVEFVRFCRLMNIEPVSILDKLQ